MNLLLILMKALLRFSHSSAFLCLVQKVSAMKHIACASCHRHSNLINSVYPTSPGEEGPKSAALSLLVFYATSKPQKLPKIGAFLEAKVEKDIGNSRFRFEID